METFKSWFSSKKDGGSTSLSVTAQSTNEPTVSESFRKGASGGLSSDAQAMGQKIVSVFVPDAVIRAGHGSSFENDLAADNDIALKAGLAGGMKKASDLLEASAKTMVAVDKSIPPLGLALSLMQLASGKDMIGQPGSRGDAAFELGTQMFGGVLISKAGGFLASIKGLAAESELTAARIVEINQKFSSGVTATGHPETVIANMAYREGAVDKAATAIRDIAGSHLFENGNKRTAQAIAEQLLGKGASPAQIRTVIDRAADSTLPNHLRTVEEISQALKTGK